jgi:hypothetical protein
MTRRDVTIHCLSTAASPVTHMARTAGNEAMIFRETVHVPGQGRRDVPAISGNSLRSLLVREPGAQVLVDRWGLAGEHGKRAMNFLFHGGTVNESTARQDPRRQAEFYRLFPLGRLLGGCLPDDFIPGHCKVDFGVLACRENGGRLASFAPAFEGIADLFGPQLRPAESFVGSWTYFRRGIDQTRPDLAAVSAGSEADPDSRGVFAGQCVIRGAVFLHRIHAERASDLEVGALLLSVATWAAAGGWVGGMSARGHGSLDTRVHLPDGVDAAACMAAYVDHVDAVRDDGVAWLRAAFEPRATEAKKVPPKRRGRNVDPGGPPLPAAEIPAVFGASIEQQGGELGSAEGDG